MSDARKAYEQARELEPDQPDQPGAAVEAEEAQNDADVVETDQTDPGDLREEGAGAGEPDEAADVDADQPPHFVDPTTHGVDPEADPHTEGHRQVSGDDADVTTTPDESAGEVDGADGGDDADRGATDGTTEGTTDGAADGATNGRSANASDAQATPDAGDDNRRAAEAVREPADEAEALRTALAEAERQRDEYLDHLRRERAEFDNFRKRNARERLEAMDRGVQSLMTELLGVLDNFGHVLAAASDSEDQALAKGAHMVHEELVGVLGRFGLEEVPGEGSPFDPQWHEAMMQVESDEDVDEPTVAQVLRSGYRFKGRVLRPASVSVAQ